MSEKLKVELQDSQGNVYYTHTSADVVFLEDGTSVKAKLENLVDKSEGDISETIVNTVETIDTKFPVPAAGDTIKRFLGKVKKFIEDFNGSTLKADVTYYINSSTGSDDNTGTSSQMAFKSIDKALSLIPKNLNGYTVQLWIGASDSDLFLSGYYNGNIKVGANGDIAQRGVKSAYISSCDAHIEINSFSISGIGIFTDGTKYALKISKCKSVQVLSTNIVGTTDINNGYVTGISCDTSASIQIINGSVSNKYRAIYFKRCGNCYVRCGGTSNHFGITSEETTVNVDQITYPSSLVPFSSKGTGAILFSTGADKLVDDILYYVTAGNGVESGDGTWSNPFTTISMALKAIPKNLGGCNAKIIINNGTYPEEVTIQGFYNGNLIITSTTPDIISSNVNVDRITINGCLAKVSVLGIKVTNSSSTIAVNVSNSNSVYLHYLQIDASVTSQTGIYAAVTNQIRIYYCDISQKNKAMDFVDSDGYIWACTGSNNTIGVVASGTSNVHIIGTIPGATTPRQTFNGGVFIGQNGTQISNVITSGLSCTWGTIQNGYIRNGNLTGIAMVTIQIGVVINTNLSAGVEYTVSGFPGAYGGNAALSVSPQTIVDTCFIDASGVIHVKFNKALSMPYGILFTHTYLTTS
ncbi:hypothetical protein SAMN05443270_3788 [Lacrimispora sphenoides]|uniref:hypothetical protein n=1 Tax=Lacrimispora sphenoides TaxID=29370 RepID=UPI0008AA8D29|nr:hypothetical protein [Lacrimispora sphenoides]SEU24409.1 hypothetical protein SAMN05443270_3788 [Lacrimispora sphenoides]